MNGLLLLLVLGAGAGLGAVVGVALAVVLSVRGGQSTDPTFTAGTAILAVLVAALASLPPAVAAAYRDPVRVLRTP